MTNQIQYLKCASEIIVLENGHISERGTLSELVSSSGAFADFLETHLKEDTAADANVDVPHSVSLNVGKSSNETTKSEVERLRKRKRLGESTKKSEISDDVTSDAKRDDDIQALHVEEGMHKDSVSFSNAYNQSKVRMDTVGTGSVSSDPCNRSQPNTCWHLHLLFQISASVLKWYVYAATLLCSMTALVFILVFAAAQALANIWLSAWSNDGTAAAARNETVDRQLVYVRLGVYTGLGAAQSKNIFDKGRRIR